MRFRGAFESVSTQECYLWAKAISLAWFDKFSTIVLQYDLKQCLGSFYLFAQCSFAATIVLAIYVDDIVMFGDDSQGIYYLEALFEYEFSYAKYWYSSLFSWDRGCSLYKGPFFVPKEVSY